MNSIYYAILTTAQHERVTFVLSAAHPAMPSLLLQPARGISSGYSCWLSLAGRLSIEKCGPWKCSHGYHFQAHKPNQSTNCDGNVLTFFLLSMNAPNKCGHINMTRNVKHRRTAAKLAACANSLGLSGTNLACDNSMQ